MLSPPNVKMFQVKNMSYIPESLQKTGFCHTTSFSKAEKRVLRKKKWQAPSEWAPKNRKIVKGQLAGNYLSLDITPHLRGIMDAAVLPFVRRLHIMAAPQTAKTTLIDTIIAWATIFAPGPAVSFYPDEVTAKRSMKERLQPMVAGSPSLSRLRSGHRDDFTNTSMALSSMTWEVGWVGSTAQTADRSLRYVDMQEVDKPSYGGSKEETGVIELLLKRPRAYGDTYKVFISSSPTTEAGNINMIIEKETEAVFLQWVRCPHCHEEVLMLFSHDTFHWPHDEEGHSIDRKTILSKKLARYICPECAALWDDNDRNKAIRRDVWRLRMVDNKGETLYEKGEEMFRYLQKHRPASIGFIVPSWTSYMVSLSEVAHDFLRSVDKNISAEERLKALKDFKNGHEAKPWKPEIVERAEASLLRLKNDLPATEVPAQGVAGLFAGVDTQDDGFWYWVMAVGYGRAPERWLLRCGFVFTFEAVVQVLWGNEYRDKNGNIYPVHLSLQDAMGHRTSDVYDFCASRHGQILPTNGQQTMATPYSTNDVEFYPGSDKRRFPGALKRVRVNTTYYKDKADGILKINPGDPGGISFYSEVSRGDLLQLCAETRNEKGFWEQIGQRDNHLWDCFCLALCAEDVAGVRYWPTPEEQEEMSDDLVVEDYAATLG
ncbi:related to terminase large subunit of phage lambda [Desulfotalea psychrophila LSv54]|uniref:Related to terminase large subunit of phage lambda n=2 Tax=Desulfotalea psychrophila TaxID=84980 RepID=Q6AMW9_DESPS|nr:related to terminase large subunit of phage lambda [Desulfotalea psychrophila LSv54]